MIPAVLAPLSDRPRLLIVDDEAMNIKVLVEMLRDDYALTVAKNGVQALERMAMDPAPDLVLLDVMMPGMDGHEVCRRMKQDPRLADVPVIFVTALGDPNDELHGFDLGAVDYLTKPLTPLLAKARVRTHVQLARAQRALENYSHTLEARVAERTQEVERVQAVTIRALASLAETRDNETGNHIRRTQHYVRALALHLHAHPRFAGQLDDRTIDLLFKSAPLHDVGKVGIPDRILLKPGPLTDEEFTIMKTHTVLGRSALRAAVEEGGESEIAFLRHACDIAAYHHEKWDGTGYPEGLAGEAIPLSARLMAVADVYDALISRRVYKPPFPHARARELIVADRGARFDPDIVDAFLALEDVFRDIRNRYCDEDEIDPS
ncbi:HD-GYP domain-containing protein [Pararhodospirillum photometricum]|uniref:Response regulator containing a CheY-like receiver domain and an HD-GYP domain n=1 Tax=Pararhodospirillum photometricum DSM 122 TaxID=1150469 RepID=H6SQP6_PARPM|nr:HD domain-containing phosphohydrolase [Pararhodospirillum photometricum]CCG07361.1 Response regulator containing a CheY-like receiver domain and an HD-GYP domain [Pararhodospirillum photometricum DSM 122]